MRRFCRACGTPLTKREGEPISEPVAALEEEPIVETPTYGEDEPLVRPSDVASRTDDAPLVRPSAIAAQQAELEPEAPAEFEEVEEPPVMDEVVTSDEEEVSEPETVDDERGKEIVADILGRVRAAEARQSAEKESIPAEEPVADIAPPPAEPLDIEEPIAYDEPLPEPEVEEPVAAQEVVPEPEPVKPEMPPVPVTPTVSVNDEIASDNKVRELENDINGYNLEIQQLKTEFDALKTHLDEEVSQQHTATEVKRIRVESCERDLDFAKKEHDAAKKAYKDVENRRKKELSNAEKRMKDVEKRLRKAEESKEKRIEEIEKERRKREEEN